MKFLAILFLIAFAVCDEVHYFRYNGTMEVGSNKGIIFGPLFFEFKAKSNLTYIGGMFVKDKVHTPFEFGAKITTIAYKEDKSFVINATFIEGKWEKKVLRVHGNVVIEGTWDKVTYKGIAEDTAGKTKYVIDAIAEKVACPYYPMPEAAVRAGYLVGEKASVYQAPHVLNHAVFGYAYLNYNCKYYHDQVGKETKELKPGVVVVGVDSAHCAIIDREGDKFIHSNPVKKEVTSNPVTMLKDYFKKGWILKEYSCNTTVAQ